MAKTRLSKATFVERGYGQVEPNHLSAQRTAQIYAQLPAKGDIDVLENGQFAKYDYAAGVVDFTGKGEWMLVFNEVKLYRDHLDYNDFAMVNTDYVARVFSPIDGEKVTYANSRDYSDMTAPADPYEVDSTTDPFIIQQMNEKKMMPEGSTMVPRMFKTNVGDIFTTNCVSSKLTGDNINTDIVVGATLAPNAKGILEVTTATEGMLWQVAKVYTLADRQKAVKIVRIA